ncbi:hypothetical protein [Pseudomonas sp. M30-35]|uniref:hypothetical protein n=1 Tax=Pseudomonas sp. M30-35 TaxID=1981174 RepID=UPI000B3C64DA|nr:hypothetical protein [Pseudomonas sp. M30-35]ARU86513.1 hypothetical protein B9K09_00215 [Pseudomonas sp. M30-35]
MNLPTRLTLVCGIASLLPGALMAQSVTADKNASVIQSVNNQLPGGGSEHSDATKLQSHSKDTAGPDAAELEKLAKATANPLGAAWMLWFQNDYTHFDGDNDALPSNGRWSNSTKFQPVMSFPYDVGDDEWNLIVRPVLQYQSSPFDDSFGDALQGRAGDIPTDKLLSHNYPYNGRTTGFGDTGLLTLTGPARDDGLVWGAGITQLFPTAEEDVLGQGKYQAGPAVLLATLAPDPGGWNVGVLAQHWWSYAGDEDRDDTSQSDIQYFLNYRLSATELVGMTPNVRVDWKADSGEKVNFPIGLGYSNVIKINKLPVRFAVEMQYSVVKGDEYDADWNLRFMFIPVIANPFKSY